MPKLRLFLLTSNSEASIDRYESIKLSLCPSDHFRVGKCTPVEFGDGADFMADKRLADSGIHTLV